MKKILLFTFYFLLITYSKSQNLVPNPSFEQFTLCPNGAGQISKSYPWVNPTNADPDYYNQCSSNTASSLPINYLGYQLARTGIAYAGIGCYNSPALSAPFRDYLQVELSSPLSLNKDYCVSFFVSLVDNYSSCCSIVAITEIGIYFSNQAVTSTSYSQLNYIPQITSPVGVYLSDTLGWTEILGIYHAQGGEKFITIGNFKGNNTDTLTVAHNNFPPSSYYFVDDVSVIDCDSLVGVKELAVSSLEFQVMPNPNNGTFTLNLHKQYKAVNIVITDVLGKIIYTNAYKESTQIPIELNTPRGVYFVNVIADDKRQVVKLVKE
jgi:hypothetical protein